MEEVKCPSCGSPNVEQIDVNKYQCPYCGETFNYRFVNPTPPKQLADDEKKDNVDSQEDDGSGCVGCLALIGIVAIVVLFIRFIF